MIYLGTEEGLYHWFAAEPWPVFHGLQHHDVLRVAAAPGGLIAALDDAGRIFESTNNGLSWREEAPPKVQQHNGRPSAIGVSTNPPAVWLGTRPLGLYRKQPGRRGWVPLGCPQVESGPMAPIPRWLFVVENRWFLAVEGAGLWRSDDQGQSWSAASGLPETVLSLRGQGDWLVAGTAQGAWASDDGGQSWQPLAPFPIESPYVRAIEIAPDDPKMLLAGAAPRPHRGSAEQPSEAEAQPQAGAVRPVGLDFRLFESKDGGQSWQHVRRGFPEALEFDQIADIRYDPAAPEYAITAFASGECWRTRNGGDWWEPIARGIGAVRCLEAIGNPT